MTERRAEAALSLELGDGGQTPSSNCSVLRCGCRSFSFVFRLAFVSSLLSFLVETCLYLDSARQTETPVMFTSRSQVE